MKNIIKYAATLMVFTLPGFSETVDSSINGNWKTAGTQSKLFGKHPGGSLVSFNSEDGKLRIDWAVTIPFISIPLGHKIRENGEMPPLLEVNTKGIGIVGLITTLFSVISPLISRKESHYNYRSEDNGQWLPAGNTISEMIFGNNYVAPCMQRFVCSIVSVATHSENQTSIDKIIDGFSSHKWFNDVANGTIIQDAIIAGRRGKRDCARIYKGCSIPPKLLHTVMNEFGIV